MKKLLFVLFLWWCGIECNAQSTFSFHTIDKDLLDNAYVVVRENSQRYECSDISSGNFKRTYTVTILDRKAHDYAIFVLNTDKFRSLKSFSGEIYDMSGRLVKKIKKSDLKFTEYSLSLAQDGRKWYYDPAVTSYPFTVTYNYEYTWKNGSFGFIPFFPVDNFHVSVENARTELICPADLKYNLKTLNFNDPEVSHIKDGRLSMVWQIKNFKSVESEYFSPSPRELFPICYFAPHEFIYDKHRGNMQTWESMAQWQWSLLKDRDKLPLEFRDEILSMTAHVESDLEKAKILYEYLGKMTRYVSIQLGIGGWQPMQASEVYKNKFGDCKGLANFMMSMLNVCGIKSHYTEIGLRNRKIFNDFPNQFQTDHVILKLELNEGIFWLECTNPEIPFGYVHSGIAGHDALVYKNGTVSLETLPDNSEAKSGVNQKIEITLKQDQSASIKCEKNYLGAMYETVLWFIKASANEKLRYIGRGVDIPISKVGNISCKENKSITPSLEISYTVEAEKFGTKTADRYFLPVNPFRKQVGRLPSSRGNDIVIESGQSQIDTVFVNLPGSFEIEGLPGEIDFSCQFGDAKMTVATEGNRIVIVHLASIRKGKYPKETYDELRELFAVQDKMISSTIVLRGVN